MTLPRKLLKLASENGSVYLRDRKVQTIFAVMGFAALMWALVLVLPAVAAAGANTTTHNVPADVHELGGQPNDCLANDGDLPAPTGVEELRIVNPVNGTYTDPDTGAQFVLSNADSFFVDIDVVGSNWLITDVIAKGGKKSAHFDFYDSVGPVSGDSDFHGPTKGNSPSDRNYFALSHVSICYDDAVNFPTTTFSGTKFRDYDNDATQDGFEPGLGGFTINVYSDGNGDGVVNGSDAIVKSTTTSSSNGSWSISIVNASGKFVVCEVGQSGWAQTAPATTNNNCPGSADEGHAVTVAAGGTASNLNFGNAHAVNLPCGTSGNEVTAGAAAAGNNFPTDPAAWALLIDGDCTPKQAIFEVYDTNGSTAGGHSVTIGGDIGTRLTSLFVRWPSETRMFDGGGATVIPQTQVIIGTTTVDVDPCASGQPNSGVPVCQRAASIALTTTTIQIDETIELLVDPPLFR